MKDGMTSGHFTQFFLTWGNAPVRDRKEVLSGCRAHPCCTPAHMLCSSDATWPWRREASLLGANTPVLPGLSSKPSGPWHKSCTATSVGFQIWMQTWLQSTVILKLIQSPWENMWADPVRKEILSPHHYSESLSKAPGLTFEDRYRNLFQERRS